MTYGLWVVNSSLLIIFSAALFANSFLRQDPPIIRIKRIVSEESQKNLPEQTSTTKTWERIYQNDIFGTFITKPAIQVTKQVFIAPIPEPKVAVVPPTPEIPKIDFIAPLAITLKGLIISADETKSIAMIADEAGKEGIYHLGEKIKDAQIIKIANNRVIFIRANGQQETFYLRKDDMPVDVAEKWKSIVKKINDQSYEVDKIAFKDEVESLGNLIEGMAVIGTAYTQGIPVGMRIGKLDPTDVGTMLGLVENDIIVSINNISTADSIERIKIYDTLTAMKIGDSFNVTLNRAGKDVDITYKLAKLEKPRKPVGLPGSLPMPKPSEELTMSAAQQREQTVRDFEKQHGNPRDQQTLMDIRRRLLENLHARIQNGRIRDE